VRKLFPALIALPLLAALLVRDVAAKTRSEAPGASAVQAAGAAR
jgi:hypothetical protein